MTQNIKDLLKLSASVFPGWRSAITIHAGMLVLWLTKSREDPLWIEIKDDLFGIKATETLERISKELL